MQRESSLFNPKATAPSLLSREESNAIKGIYMLLIVLGHNWFFTMATIELCMMEYFYMFHIAGFFMLPFLYGSRGLTWQGIGNHAARLMWPFLILTTVFYVGVWVVAKGNDFSAGQLLDTLASGSSGKLKLYCGFQVLWFLPSMFAAMIIHDLAFTGRFFKAVVLILGLWFLADKALDTWNVDFRADWRWRIPFGVGYILPFCMMGIVARWLLLNVRNRKVFCVVCFLIIVAVTVYFFSNLSYFDHGRFIDRGADVGEVFYPVAFMFIVVSASRWLIRFGWLEWIGRNSLIIYLAHPFVGFALMMLLPDFPHLSVAMQIPIIVVALSVVLVVSVGVAMLINRLKPLKRFLFPHNLNEWISIWS